MTLFLCKSRVGEGRRLPVALILEVTALGLLAYRRNLPTAGRIWVAGLAYAVALAITLAPAFRARPIS
jgi:hypothetical protein